MENKELSISLRDSSGSRVCRRLRREGNIPVVVYNHKDICVNATVVDREFVKLAKRSLASQVFKLTSDSKDLDGRSVIVKNIQREPLKGTVLHIDFLALQDKKPVTVSVALNPQGEARGVKTEGGILSVMAREVTISCLPKDIPLEISYDVSGLALSESIHAKELELPEGAELVSDGNVTVATVVGSRASRLMSKDEDAEGEESAESAETGGEAS